MRNRGGLAEFLVASRHAAPILEMLKDVFNQVSLALKFSVRPSLAGLIGTRRYAGQAAVVLDKVSEFIRVEALVPDEDHGVGQKQQKLLSCCRVSALTG